MARRVPVGLRLCGSLAGSTQQVLGQPLDSAGTNPLPCSQIRAPFEKKLAEDPRLFDSLAAEIAALEAELAALGSGGSGANGTVA